MDQRLLETTCLSLKKGWNPLRRSITASRNSPISFLLTKRPRKSDSNCLLKWGFMAIRPIMLDWETQVTSMPQQPNLLKTEALTSLRYCPASGCSCPPAVPPEKTRGFFGFQSQSINQNSPPAVSNAPWSALMRQSRIPCMKSRIC